MKRVAILQSAYIPWKGYLDIIGMVDVFVVYDDVQYRKNHWHNRNLIKTQHGTKWLTIPVAKAEGSFIPIDQVRISQPFAEKHWRSIAQSYSRAPFFRNYARQLEMLYQRADAIASLSDVNMMFLHELSTALGFSTRFVRSTELKASGDRNGRLVAICNELGAGSYLSGPAAQAYIETEQFAEAGITVEWMDYSGYPEYPQLHGPFEHSVSILDLLMNVGPHAQKYLKAGGPAPVRPEGERTD